MFGFPGRSRRNNPRAELEQQLTALERQAKTASPGFEAQFYNRAADLCVEAGQADRAVRYYGRAIDTYLESVRFDAARAICRKVLRSDPRTVRVHCTLAWLAIGNGHLDEARRCVADYVRAATRVGSEALARKQLGLMGQAVESDELRQILAEHLLTLGDSAGADKLLGTMYAARNAGTGAATPEDQGRRWDRVLRAALMGPGELASADASVR